MNEVILFYITALLLAWPLGRYMTAAFSSTHGSIDRVFGPFENALYKLSGVNAVASMDWRGYAKAMLKLHFILATVACLIFYYQEYLPINPDKISGMSWDLSLHTAMSFLTNTNQQHYSGQAQLSYFAQMFAIVMLQVVTPAAGLATVLAILRTLFAKPDSVLKDDVGHVLVGNFYVDLVRSIVRVLLPLSFITAMLLAWQGVPSTFAGAQTVNILDPTSEVTEQNVPVGPVASMVAIKQIGTNGGGWYGPNSAVPLENPTPASNFVEMLAIVIIPIATIFMVGYMTGRKRLAAGIFGVMLILSFSLTGLAVWSENQPNPAFAGLSADGTNMEGKEVRFGATSSALWGAVTTQTSNGSVNAMHDSFNPGGGIATLVGMFINSIFGGIGVGLINYILVLLVATFMGSLMIGRSPEFLGRALETREIKLLSIAILIQPLLVLGMSAAAFAFGFANNSNPGFHAVSQVVYEYASAFADNGSGFEGLGDNTIWWNITCSMNLALGRFIPILAPLAIAASMAGKRPAPVGRGSLDVETLTFAYLTLGVIILVSLLSFMPVLVIGPIAEALSL